VANHPAFLSLNQQFPSTEGNSTLLTHSKENRQLAHPIIHQWAMVPYCWLFSSSTITSQENNIPENQGLKAVDCKEHNLWMKDRNE